MSLSSVSILTYFILLESGRVFRLLSYDRYGSQQESIAIDKSADGYERIPT